MQQRNIVMRGVGILVRARLRGGQGTGDRAVCCWRWHCAARFEGVHSWASGMALQVTFAPLL